MKRATATAVVAAYGEALAARRVASLTKGPTCQSHAYIGGGGATDIYANATPVSNLYFKPGWVDFTTKSLTM